ncbi:hypothetical protein ASPZODRAFT_55920 [Penicilliopsis zonata CBS 506.65]|uniref:tripeptidyl-peptidase II n=1 Tax=Penicilliopsis zonata CBS 506.65 TaxID=1073090 RepID=A0A1L9SU49_9EURO|nr:hypothetical protein ASPZODRAFT_55920 [Penicilliopsis zonata CBS 506.65]OJJ50641.1 hypothetical protein ASPZODRAFT_55920 [Penicilliopsis zonata CBS 506.65]
MLLFPFICGGAWSLAITTLLISSATAEVFERLRAVPSGWSIVGTPDPSQAIRLQIALQQQNIAGFEKALLAMSTPGDPGYGKHFRTHDEMKRMLLPSDTAVDTVRGWLESFGITDIEVDADWINFQTTVGQANDLLDTQFRWYASDVRQVRRLRTLEYSVPASVAVHINMVQPTTRFGQIRPNRATGHQSPERVDSRFQIAALAASNGTDCNTAITPQCLKALYKVGDYNANAQSGSKIAFCSYLEQVARYSDLTLFETSIAPDTLSQNFSVVTYSGGVDDQTSTNDSGEANLDLQYIIGMSSPLPVTEYITGGRGLLVPDLDEPSQSDNNNEPYLAFLQNVIKLPQEELPQVISTSYGEDEQSIPESYARSVCNLYAQLGSRGVSVLFSSGDSGVGSACETNDGTNRTHFPPQFPASCPWVTSVGATTGTNPEAATYFSSGGFSDYWARPDWQETAVSAYLQTLGDKWQGLYNASGRAFPDVAAQGMKYAVYEKGVLDYYEGTSCAAPVFSALIALLNDARLRVGRSSLGFLNPWLYGTAQTGLTDIVNGGSTGCNGRARFDGASNGSPIVPYASWNATAGWDPVTGLGTPNFEALLQIALN